MKKEWWKYRNALLAPDSDSLESGAILWREDLEDWEYSLPAGL